MSECRDKVSTNLNTIHNQLYAPKWVWVPAVIGLLLIILYPIATLPHLSVASMGQFGDMFGAINTVISIFGFAGLLWSLHLQREQFRASLQDMQDNTEASRDQASAARGQAEALSEQNQLSLQKLESDKIMIRVQILASRLISIDASIAAMIEAPKATGVRFDPNSTTYKQIQDLRSKTHSELSVIAADIGEPIALDRGNS